MNTTATTYVSRNQGSQAGTDAFAEAITRVQQIATLAQAVTFDLGLLDYLATRVETHTAESRRAMADLMGDVLEGDAAQALRERLAAIESEAARTFLVAAGLRPGAIAPVDYPTITRAYLVARAATGHQFSVRVD